jgi:hypothetical protein
LTVHRFASLIVLWFVTLTLTLIQKLTTQADHLKGFSHVIEDIFLLLHGNVIQQALLDLWGASDNLCTIYTLLTVPLHSLQVTYGVTSVA